MENDDRNYNDSNHDVSARFCWEFHHLKFLQSLNSLPDIMSLFIFEMVFLKGSAIQNKNMPSVGGTLSAQIQKNVTI